MKKEWLPTPVFLPGEAWWATVHKGHKESDKSEQLTLSPRLNDEEKESPGRITSREVESASENFPTKESPEQEITSVKNSIKHTEIVPTLLKLSQKAENEGTVFTLFYEFSIILIPKPDKDTTRKD